MGSDKYIGCKSNSQIWIGKQKFNDIDILIPSNAWVALEIDAQIGTLSLFVDELLVC
jgi:predicted membrane protein